MRVDVTPRRADVAVGQPTSFVVSITNTSTVIGGYAVRVLGADPGWVSLEPTGDLSLFPDETQTLRATVTIPEGISAGTRRIAFQVRELTPPEANTVVELDLVVPAIPAVGLRVDPVAVTAGRGASFSLVVTNTGNTRIERGLRGDDAEGKVRFRFLPNSVDLGPGEHAVVDLRVSARRRFMGTPAVRLLSFYLDETSAAATAAAPGAPEMPTTEPEPHKGAHRTIRARNRKRHLQPARDEREAVASASMIQRPVISRGGLSLVGLLAAITVFGLVITLAMTRLVGQSTADRDLALQIASAGDSAKTVGTSSVSGTVVLLTSGKPVPGVSVAIYQADDTSTPLTTTATDTGGKYKVEHLPAGDYKISYRGAGFIQLWYPGATTDADATAVTLAVGQQRNGVDVRLGGVPAQINGKISGEDVSASTLYLETTPMLPTAGTPSGAARIATPGIATSGGAIVATIPVGSDGSFSFTNVPSPSIYTIRVTKPGYATSTQRIDIGAGETRNGVEIMLRKGDGLVSGTVTAAGGPVGEATITATAGDASSSTVSLTEGDVGSFTLRGLPTPTTLTLTASKPGYASQTLTLTLADGQKLTGVSIPLSRSAGSLAGTVTLLPDGAPAPGVTVTVTNGSLTINSQTESTGKVGSWKSGGLPVPGTYTVTFSRSDLVSQTVSVSLDEVGNITPGSYGAQITGSKIAVAMQSATATVRGTVTQRVGADAQRTEPAGEATIELSSGSATYLMTTASTPAGSVGKFRIQNLPPGTYTVSVSRLGASPTSTILNLRAGQTLDYDPVLAASASITGSVVSMDGTKLRKDWIVQLYVAAQYPTVVAETTRTSADGTFAFDGIDAPQAYVLVARPTQASVAAGSITKQIRASQHLSVKIKADPGD